ncbi:MAG TPA: NAD(P)/FAD-dependent oxidoreductase [Acidimicrobiia bacterium]|nr:NAD(P)/FAD-dependent oxidoreductase [Acidimicrobiia bacterium]
MNPAPEHVNTLVIGGGQAGLAVGYHLSRVGVPFLIVDANRRTGDSWRNRWDSLRLFTPNRFNSLPGLPIPGEDWSFPTKDELGDYLETYAAHFDLPIRHEVKVERLGREGKRFVVAAGDQVFEADNVIVARASYQEPKTPPLASEIDPGIVQLHADDYRNPGQLQDGDVLVVGLGNSGAEIAKELIRDRRVWLSGEPSGVQPFRPEKLSGRMLMPLVGPVILNRVLTTSTPMGRRVHSKMRHRGAPLMRVKPKDLVAAGVQRVGRVVAAVDGRPQVEDGTVLDVRNIVWSTGYGPGYGWVDLPVFDEVGDVVHSRGIVDQVPGLYFVAVKFLYSVLSDTLLGVGRDAAHVVDHLVAHRHSPSVTSAGRTSA